MRFTNLALATSVGMLFTVTDEAHFKRIKGYTRGFREEGIKNVKALGFFPGKELPHWVTPGIDFDFFTAKELSWFSKPQSTVVKNFVQTPFDVLIDTDTEHLFPLDWVLRTSQAHLKAGRQVAGREELYDLMIALPKDAPLASLMQQVRHYLTEINKKAS